MSLFVPQELLGGCRSYNRLRWPLVSEVVPFLYKGIPFLCPPNSFSALAENEFGGLTRPGHTLLPGTMPLVASLILVEMPFAPTSFLFLVARPGAPSSILAPSSSCQVPSPYPGVQYRRLGLSVKPVLLRDA